MQLTQLGMNEHFSKVSASLVLQPAELGCVADPAKAQTLLSSPISHSAMLSGALWLTWGWKCLQGGVLLHSCFPIMKPEDTSRHLSWFWHRLGGDVWDESGPKGHEESWEFDCGPQNGGQSSLAYPSFLEQFYFFHLGTFWAADSLSEHYQGWSPWNQEILGTNYLFLPILFHLL